MRKRRMERTRDLIRFLKDIVPPEDKELGERMDLAEVLFDGLLSAYQSHKELGEEGKEIVAQEEDVVQTHLKADIEAEERVLSELEKWVDKNDYLIEYWAEELGKGEIVGPGGISGERYYGDDGSFFVTLDGLDGSANFLEDNRDFSYGTMVAIAKGENPTYSDFEAAGIMLAEEGWILLAVKGLGVWVYEIDKNEISRLADFDQNKEFNGLVLADSYYPEAKAMLGKLQESWPRSGSTAASIAAIVIRDRVKDGKFPKMNQGWQALFEVTRKDNLEQPTIFVFATELGGDMVDELGETIADNEFKEWGQKSHEPVITVINKKVKRKVFEKLSQAGK